MKYQQRRHPQHWCLCSGTSDYADTDIPILYWHHSTHGVLQCFKFYPPPNSSKYSRSPPSWYCSLDTRGRVSLSFLPSLSCVHWCRMFQRQKLHRRESS